ncbi:hypothetical protein Lal_00012369 [Lupinus albus]|nr:hypothetical protein Lal_00012369 [Lupinus albus]
MLASSSKPCQGQEQYLLYKTINKNGVTLDNRHIIPYNRKLVLKCQAYINIEWCNQSNSIKYQFKYIHNGYDWVIATIIPTENESSSQVKHIDEIKQYFDGIYIYVTLSPAVERLYFHLENEKSVIFDDSDVIDDILSKTTVKDSMFTSWMGANKKYVSARDLTYAQFVSKFVYISGNICWKPRKLGYTIGRLSGNRCFKNDVNFHQGIMTVNNVIYPTFREACFAMRFIEDDREYIEAIKETNELGAGY